MADILISALTAVNSSPDEATRKQAEQTLFNLQQKPEYSAITLQALQNTTLHPSVRLAVCIEFKNHVKKHWASTDVISAENKTYLKSGIIQLMLSSTDKIRDILMEAVSIMAAYDWPASWPNLLPELVQHLSQTTDVLARNGILKTIHAVVRRFRFDSPSDRVMREFKAALAALQEPILAMMQQYTQLVQQNGGNRKLLKQAFAGLLLLARTFYDLNYIDIPEFFEDHKKEFMFIFNGFLTYENALLEDPDEDVVAGPVQKLQAAILRNLQLYSEKYEEEFSEFLQGFVTVAWNLVTKTNLQQKYNKVVTRALQFMTTVARSVAHEIFKNPDTLRSVLEHVIVRNIQFTDADEEQFNDNAVEYIRRDIEGSESDTRRRACVELVRALREKNEGPVTELCLAHVHAMLKAYADNPANWKQKDAAMFLVTALTVKSATQAAGSTDVSALVNVVDFLAQQVVPELQTDPNTFPVLKADAIKVVTLFRQLIPKQGLLTLLPLLGSMVRARHYVVHSYAANAIERLLMVRDGTVPRVTRDDLRPMLEQMFAALFFAMEQEGSKENDYIMKAVMRLISVVEADVIPHSASIMGGLYQKMSLIAHNPSNPNFTHYLFETLAALIKVVCTADASNVVKFEGMLFPVFQQILQADMQEMMTYVLQILSQLLEFNPSSSVNPAYGPLFTPLLSPILWERVGNIPGLVRLIQAYLHKCPQLVTGGGHLSGVLGVFQKLVASKSNDHYGVYVLQAVFESVPLADFKPMLPEILRVMFTRLQLGSTPKFIKLLIVAVSVLIVKHGGQVAVEAMEAVQAGISGMVFGQLWLPNVQKISSVGDKKMVQVAMIRLLAQTPAVTSGPLLGLWGPLFMCLVRFFELPEEEDEYDAEDAFLEVDETPGYSAAFAQLHYARAAESDPVPDVPDPKLAMARALAEPLGAAPQQFVPLVKQDPSCFAAFNSYLARAGMPPIA